MARRRHIDRAQKQRRERKYRLQSKTTRFIPDGDRDFAQRAKQFAGYVETHAERLRLSAEPVTNLSSAVTAFRDALARTMNSTTCGPFATQRKNTAREKAKECVRSVAAVLRGLGKDVLTPSDRLALNINERPAKLNRRECPDLAPVLVFKGSTTPDSYGGKHILEYRNDFGMGQETGAKPRGAARLEVFVELVPPELASAGRIPQRPGDLRGGSLWYLRSYTTSRFEVRFPVMADGSPALVVYWGRWADAKGGVGPFSKVCVARTEGGTALPIGLPGKQSTQIRVEQVVHQLEARVIAFASHALPAAEREFEAADGTRLLEAA